MCDFKELLRRNNISELKKIGKVDIHNHAVYSCTKSYLKKMKISIENDKIYNIQTLIDFSRKYISPIQLKEDGLRILLEGNFENCINNGVKVVCTEIDYKNCIRTFNSNIEEFISFLKSFKYDNLDIYWNLGISRDSYKEEYKNIIIELLKTGFFSGIDLTSTENIIPNSRFIDFYKIAESIGMYKIVHAGEQLGADYVKQCIVDFNPDQIQHGISIIEDIEVMKLAKERSIIFNVCPTSNVVLGYVKDIKSHPIKKMFEYGLNVTIGTDDLLFFDSNINDEYLKLYNEKVLTEDQLDDIRRFGLNIYNKKR